MKKLFLLILILFSTEIFAEEIKGKELYRGEEYIVRLINGDLISGKLEDFTNSETKGKGIELKTLLGKALIYESEIKFIQTYEENFRHSHRIFLMPTAEPIGKNHFIGSFELLFFYAGFGITDYFSATLGTTAVPNLYEGQQAYLLNVKSTVYQQYWESMYGKMSIALGYNLAFINDDNKFSHFYAASTFRMRRTGFTMNLFYKSGNKTFYELNIQDNVFPFTYADGAFGLGLGIDNKISDRHGLYFIGELWVSDINNPSQSAATLGIRLANSAFAADFGLALFPAPQAVPYVSFVWTPF